MNNLVLIVGNGLTIDLLKCISKIEDINTKNLFRNGDKVEWPDGSNEKGFLSYKRCKNLWNLGARPSMNDNEAQELVEEIISCANTIPKNMLDDKSENIYVNAYFELVAYIKQLFIMYNKKVSEEDLSSSNIINWGWYKLIKRAYNSAEYERIYIITYNYDIYLERVLKVHNIPFDIVGIEENDNKVKIVKPHGSISFCHKSINDKDTYDIKRSSVLYEAELNDFEVRYERLDENYSVYALIPPSGDSTRMLFKWAEEMRMKEKEIIKTLQEDDKIIVSGLSYWHVDRKEIDDILTTIGAKSNVYMVNPNPPKVLNAVLSCIFDNYILYTGSEEIGELL